MIPKEIHGAFAIINSIVFLVTLFSEGGVGSALIQRKIINEKHVSISFYITLIISLCFFITLYFLSGYIEAFYDGKIEAIHIKIASFSFLTMAIGKVSRALLVKEFRFKEIFISSSLSFFIGYIVCGIYLANAGYGIWSFILALLIFQTLKSALFFFFARHSLTFSYGKEEFNQIVYFGSSFTLIRITNYISAQIDKILLGKLIDTGSLGLFEKAQFISKMPAKYVGNTIDSVLFSYISKVEQKEKKEQYFALIAGLLFIIGGYFGVVIYFNAQIFINILLGANWDEVIPLLEVLAISIPFVLLGRLSDILVRAENKIFYSAPIKIIYILLIVSSIFLVYQESLLKIISYLVGCVVIHGVLMIGMIVKTLKFSIVKILTKNVFAFLCIVLLFFKYQVIYMLFESLGVNNILHFVIQIGLDFFMFIFLNKFFFPDDVKKFTGNLITPLIKRFRS